MVVGHATNEGLISMQCNSRHTKYQPTDEEWKCPKCGRGNESFWIDEEFGEDGCDKLHDDDTIRCFQCGYDTTGKAFAASIQLKKNLVTCPCCKGSGLVPKKKG